MSSTQSILTLPFSDRAQSPSLPPLSRYLLNLIAIKQSNLCVSADVHTTRELIQLAEEVGESICVLKTHADIIDDFSKDTIAALQDVSRRKHFLIFEDRKFGDIGSTSLQPLPTNIPNTISDKTSPKPDTLQSQYTRGPLSIATWAHITNAHLFPGPSIIPALHTAALETLTSLNHSVATTISTGTPRRSLEEPSPTSPTTTTTKPTNSPPTTNTALLFTHTRTHGATAKATTTITQTYEPASPTPPPNPPSSTPQTLAHSLLALGSPPHARGLLLLAQMSSEANLFTPSYTTACLSAARSHSDFVLGFVSQRSLNEEVAGDKFVSFAPGVSLPPEGLSEGKGEGEDKEGEGKDGKEGTGMRDGKGQVYRMPEEVVGRDGIDVVIVGRGVLRAEDRGREAERYRRVAWEAYLARVGGERGR